MTRPLRAPGAGQRLLSAARSLRSPSSGLLGQGVRFVLAGGITVVVYVTTTNVLAYVVGLHFQLALAIGFSVGIIVNFTLQRMVVWAHQEEFALPLRHQAGRYLAVAAIGYGVSAASTSLLPAALGVSTEIVYLTTVVALPVINFLLSRHGIFHAEPAAEDPAPVPIIKGDGQA